MNLTLPWLLRINFLKNLFKRTHTRSKESRKGNLEEEQTAQNKRHLPVHLHSTCTWIWRLTAWRGRPVISLCGKAPWSSILKEGPGNKNIVCIHWLLCLSNSNCVSIEVSKKLVASYSIFPISTRHYFQHFNSLKKNICGRTCHVLKLCSWHWSHNESPKVRYMYRCNIVMTKSKKPKRAIK